VPVGFAEELSYLASQISGAINIGARDISYGPIQFLLEFLRQDVGSLDLRRRNE
jgi:hypothetical protein